MQLEPEFVLIVWKISYSLYVFATEQCWGRHCVFRLIVCHIGSFVCSSRRTFLCDVLRTAWVISMKHTGNVHLQTFAQAWWPVPAGPAIMLITMGGAGPCWAGPGSKLQPTQTVDLLIYAIRLSLKE